jgi:hypothetical protein
MQLEPNKVLLPEGSGFWKVGGSMRLDGLGYFFFARVVERIFSGWAEDRTRIPRGQYCRCWDLGRVTTQRSALKADGLYAQDGKDEKERFGEAGLLKSVWSSVHERNISDILFQPSIAFTSSPHPLPRHPPRHERLRQCRPQ